MSFSINEDLHALKFDGAEGIQNHVCPRVYPTETIENGHIWSVVDGIGLAIRGWTLHYAADSFC